VKVKATNPGFYGSYREIDAEFDVQDGETASWFEPVKTEKQTSKKGDAKPVDAEPVKAEKPSLV